GDRIFDAVHAVVAAGAARARACAGARAGAVAPRAAFRLLPGRAALARAGVGELRVRDRRRRLLDEPHVQIHGRRSHHHATGRASGRAVRDRAQGPSIARLSRAGPFRVGSAPTPAAGAPGASGAPDTPPPPPAARRGPLRVVEAMVLFIIVAELFLFFGAS